MLQISNRTRLKPALTVCFDASGRELVCVVVKGTFTIPAPGGDVRLAEEQVAPLFADVHYEDPEKTSIRYPADVILGKPATDVVLVGSAKLPGSPAVRRLEASVRLGSLMRSVVVSGDRSWETHPFGPGFIMTEPEPFHEMPIVYERAFGGRDPTAADAPKGWDSRNPICTGFRVNRAAVHGTPIPNIEDPGHLIRAWDDRPPVAGFGATDGLWEPRRSFAGTYDEEWQDSQAPLLPTDFDLRFFNAAPQGLVANGFLRDSEIVELVHLCDQERIVFEMPIAEVNLSFRIGDTFARRRADLWTIVLEPGESRYFATWGCAFDIGKQPARAYAIEVSVDGPMARALATNGKS